MNKAWVGFYRVDVAVAVLLQLVHATMHRCTEYLLNAALLVQFGQLVNIAACEYTSIIIY